MQIIALALPQGVILFAIVAVVGLGALSQPPSGTMFSFVAAGFAGFAFVAHLVFPRFMVARAPGGASPFTSEMQACSAFQTQMIVRIAVLEGAAFFNVICSIIEHNWWSLGIAGLLVGWMLTNFPTRNRVERWIAEQRRANRE
jgi:hypothetical protein